MIIFGLNWMLTFMMNSYTVVHQVVFMAMILLGDPEVRLHSQAGCVLMGGALDFKRAFVPVVDGLPFLSLPILLSRRFGTWNAHPNNSISSSYFKVEQSKNFSINLRFQGQTMATNGAALLLARLWAKTTRWTKNVPASGITSKSNRESRMIDQRISETFISLPGSNSECYKI